MSRSIWLVILDGKGIRMVSSSEVVGISEILANKESLTYGCG